MSFQKTFVTLFLEKMFTSIYLPEKYWNYHGFPKSSFRMKDSNFIPAELGEAITLYWDASKV